MSTSPSSAAHSVVIAGGGIAGVEAALALRSLAGAAVEVTLLAPNDELRYRPLAVADSFGRPTPRRFRLDEICEDLGVTLHQDALCAVDGTVHELRTDLGARIPYDSLVIAVGARARRTLPRAHTFLDVDAESLRWLLREVDARIAKRIAFVVPADTGWSLPLYELALMTATHAREMGIEDLALTLVTPEDVPLAAFRGAGSAAVGDLLDAAGVELLAATYARDYDGRTLALAPGGRTLRADRVVALPALSGPAIAGVPCDPAGFVRVDEQGRVLGAADVYAVGDATTFPIRQGGLASQQADLVAALIARAAGLGLSVPHTRPRLRAMLLTGRDPLYLRATLTGGESVVSTASWHCPWWPPHKIAARHLAPYLADRHEAHLADRDEADTTATATVASRHALAAPRDGDPLGRDV